jgi:transposase-like protein
MVQRRRKYDPEVKREVVRLVAASKKTVALDLGV